MGMFKKIFKDEDAIVGLCGLKKHEMPLKQIASFAPKINPEKVVFGTNYQKNLFIK